MRLFFVLPCLFFCLFAADLQAQGLFRSRIYAESNAREGIPLAVAFLTIAENGEGTARVIVDQAASNSIPSLLFQVRAGGESSSLVPFNFMGQMVFNDIADHALALQVFPFPDNAVRPDELPNPPDAHSLRWLVGFDATLTLTSIQLLALRQGSGFFDIGVISSGAHLEGAIVAVPEPASIALAAVGLLTIVAFRRGTKAG